MIKFKRIILIGLISCLSFKTYSNIGQKLVDGIRQSNISIVEAEIDANKITNEEAKGLLEIAQQIEAKKKAALNKSPRKLKSLIKLLKHMRLLFLGTVTMGAGIYAGLAANIVLGNGQGDKEIGKICAPIFGLISVLSGSYAFYLYRKISRFKAKQDQYYDSMAIRQILGRVAEMKNS